MLMQLAVVQIGLVFCHLHKEKGGKEQTLLLVPFRRSSGQVKGCQWWGVWPPNHCIWALLVWCLWDMPGGCVPAQTQAPGAAGRVTPGGLESEENLKTTPGIWLLAAFMSGKDRTVSRARIQFGLVYIETCPHPAVGICQEKRCGQQLGSLSFSHLSHGLENVFISSSSEVIYAVSVSCMYSVHFFAICLMYKARSCKPIFGMHSKDHKVLTGAVTRRKMEETNEPYIWE